MQEGNRHKNVLIELHDLAIEKNKRYGNSVGKAYEKRGMVSILIRLEDKLNRLDTLVDNPEMGDNGESIRDTLMDLANYAVFGVIYLDKEKQTPKQLNLLEKEHGVKWIEK